MEKVWLYSLGSVLIVSAISLVGIFSLLLNKSFFKRIQTLLVSFAVGTLIGGAVLHLLPESLEHDHDKVAPLFVIISIVAFFILEKYLNAHRHYKKGAIEVKSFGPLNLFADALHNFLDGILIAAAFSVDVHTGMIATIAVLAHELPQEIGDFAVLIQAGYSIKRAIIYNLISALAAVVGSLFVLLFPHWGGEVPHFILPLAAGGFLYIALADLVPELNKNNTIKRSFFQVIFMLAGLLLMWFLLDFHFLHH
ncbi:MAG TPA: ZIP family metal transporter [Bacteroidales bacterium]|jgi:zinc and cadmium transporter|nr:ZIP family metal transporter [Bacteroidales bacterium]